MKRIITEDERARIASMLALPMSRKLRLAWALRHDSRVTRIMMFPLAAVIAYIILPVHVLPRRVPFLRTIDNLLIAGVGLWLFVKVMPSDLLDEHLERVKRNR
jgi:uncharacterized membrane protein YkvA (DUF1232 family)